MSLIHQKSPIWEEHAPPYPAPGLYRYHSSAPSLFFSPFCSKIHEPPASSILIGKGLRPGCGPWWRCSDCGSLPVLPDISVCSPRNIGTGSGTWSPNRGWRCRIVGHRSLARSSRWAVWCPSWLDSALARLATDRGPVCWLSWYLYFVDGYTRQALPIWLPYLDLL